MQLNTQLARIKDKRGDPRGEYAEAMYKCHFMTADFAEFILREVPSVDVLVGSMSSGRLRRLGISPTDIDEVTLRSELSELYASHRSSTEGDVRDRSRVRVPVPDDECASEAGQPCYAVLSAEDSIPSIRSGALRILGDHLEHHLTRRRLGNSMRTNVTLLPAGVLIAAIATSLWLARASLEKVLVEPSLKNWLAAAAFVMLVALAGMMIGLVIADVRYESANGFFLVARELSRHTVLQGRRDREFLGALRQLRPDVFKRSRVAGLPRLVTVIADQRGLLLLGRGRRPRVVAAFHWVNVTGSSQDVPAHRVTFTIRRQGVDTPLRFRLERAKVAMTGRSYLEYEPLKAVLESVDTSGTRSILYETSGGMRNADDQLHRLRVMNGADNLAGSDLEREALAFESERRAPLRLKMADRMHTRLAWHYRAIVILALILWAGPAMLALYLR